MKRVLITGAFSYIGEAFRKWVAERYPGEFQVAVMDLHGEDWKKKSFAGYESVLHVAGIAHADVGKVSEERKAFYYRINRDLAIETAKKAKECGVKQFVFMSSMIIYGESAGIGRKKTITKETKPKPANFYGDSKWQADKGVRRLQGERFKTAVIRPPMIYGRGSKGNYPVLAKLARRIFVFPDIKNERSMLHIDHLCEFLRLLILSGEGGIYFPQNREYVCTSEMVREIAKVKGHRIMLTKLLNPAVWAASKIPGRLSGSVNKAFGNLVYEQGMSDCFEKEYQMYDLSKTIYLTEGYGG